MIAWDHPEGVIEGLIDRAGAQRRARIEIHPRGKRVFLNGQLVRKLSRFFGNLNAIVFSPDDIALVKGAPDGRRKFLDRCIFNCEASYLADAMAYEGVLKQRNALLKDSGGSKALLDVYDEQLATFGAVLVRRRLIWLQEFAPLFAETFSSIFSGEETEIPLRARIDYQQAWLGPLDDSLLETVPEQDFCQDALYAALRASRNEDLRRRFTTRGPHRDDLDLLLETRSAKSFASQGQQRAIVLALKIAEVCLFERRRGFRPILLLDDVSSELDRARNRFLFDFLRRSEGQVFITTTHRDHILLEEEVSTFEVDAGQVTQV